VNKKIKSLSNFLVAKFKTEIQEGFHVFLTDSLSILLIPF